MKETAHFFEIKVMIVGHADAMHATHRQKKLTLAVCLDSIHAHAADKTNDTLPVLLTCVFVACVQLTFLVDN